MINRCCYFGSHGVEGACSDGSSGSDCRGDINVLMGRYGAVMEYWADMAEPPKQSIHGVGKAK